MHSRFVLLYYNVFFASFVFFIHARYHGVPARVAGSGRVGSGRVSSVRVGDLRYRYDRGKEAARWAYPRTSWYHLRDGNRVPFLWMHNAQGDLEASKQGVCMFWGHFYFSFIFCFSSVHVYDYLGASPYAYATQMSFTGLAFIIFLDLVPFLLSVKFFFSFFHLSFSSSEFW